MIYTYRLTADATLEVEESTNVVLVTPGRRVTITNVQEWIDQLTIARTTARAAEADPTDGGRQVSDGDWTTREGRLSDGTPLRDVVPEMPLECRFAGTNEWHLGIVLSVDEDEDEGPDADGAMASVNVEFEGGGPVRFAPEYLRRPRSAEKPGVRT